MKKQQYEELCKNSQAYIGTISIEDIEGAHDGTLLWGYTCDRNSFHVYLKSGQIHRVIYTFEGDVLDYICGEELEAKLLSPSKRIYPEATSFDFVIALRKADCDTPLTNFNEDREEAIWYGKVYEDLNAPQQDG